MPENIKDIGIFCMRNEVIKDDGEEGNKYINSEVESFQSGAFRTNCIDCLDRTNIVQ